MSGISDALGIGTIEILARSWIDTLVLFLNIRQSANCNVLEGNETLPDFFFPFFFFEVVSRHFIQLLHLSGCNNFFCFSKWQFQEWQLGALLIFTTTELIVYNNSQCVGFFLNTGYKKLLQLKAKAV